LVESANAAHDELVRNFEPCFDIIVPSEPGEGVPLVGNGGENTINNHFLFRLGVFLLEMALGQPLAQLPKPPGLVDGMSRDQIDYFTAVHNQPMTGKAMGPLYSTIVKQVSQVQLFLSIDGSE
jgi:hypothetical protein